METLTVYSKEACVQCDATKRSLGKKAIAYIEVMLETVPEKLEEFKEMGHMSAPIVDTGTEVWSGFRPDKIAELEIVDGKEES